MACSISVMIMGVAAQDSARSETSQFILFDIEFTYSKEDADHSTPSKSHSYITQDMLHESVPNDWTTPIDYRNGFVHVRIEVIDKPEGGAPTTWTLCYIPNKGQGNGYGCTGTPIFEKEGIYERDVSMQSFWENDAIIWSEGIKQMDLVIKDDSGGSGHAHKRDDHERYFPTKVRITMVQVAAGATYHAEIIPSVALLSRSKG